MVASTEIQDNYRDQIILHYYNEFVSSLKNIGFMNKPPPMLDLNIELLKNGFLGINKIQNFVNLLIIILFHRGSDCCLFTSILLH